MSKKWDLNKHAKNSKTKVKKGCSVLLLIIMIAIFAGIGAAVGGIFGFLETSSDINLDEYMITDNISTIFYDKDGNQVGMAHSGENRTLVALNQVPYYLQKAFISIEDERFNDHHGIDYKRTAGAILDYVKTLGKGTYGGSTITQQLIKNVTDDTDKSPVRKVREWWRATLLERELSKDQILELYLNTINFGKGYGVQTASNAFFGKDVSELSLAESALLAGIPNRPTYYNPFTNMDNAVRRQKVILGKMLELGYIDRQMYDEALAEKIVLKEGTTVAGSKQSYFVDMVINDVIADLVEKEKITTAMASKMIYGGGLKIYTTMDSKIQKAMNEVYVDEDAEVFSAFKKQTEQPESAMVIMDYTKGYILGAIGGRGEKKEERGFNRATQAYRQPGSTIKPIAVYGPALNDKVITAASIVSDTPVTVPIPGSKPWTPINWYYSYYGNVTIRSAIEKSMNIPAVRILQKIGINRAYNALKSVGITSLQSADLNYAPLSLGGLTKGVSPREWTGAYAMIANGGVFNQPVSYTKVVDSKGQILLQNKTQSERIMSEQAAFVLKDMLRTVVTTGTATTARLSNMTAAGKTGSTSDNNDKWFVGFTPYYVGAVWVGYDEPKAIEVGGEISKQIWKKVMTKIHAGLTDPGFVAPSGVSKISVCSSTGLRNTAYCPVGSEWFIDDTIPGYCTTHGAPVYTPPVNGEYPEGL